MADFPPGYDPIQADYVTPQDQAIGGLIGLTAFGMIGVGAFFTLEAMALEEALTINYVITGTTIYAGGSQITAGRAAILATLEAHEIAIAAGGEHGAVLATLEAVIASWGLTTYSVESLILLADYDVTLNQWDSQRMSTYIGGFFGGGVAGGGGGGPGYLPGGNPLYPGGGGSHPGTGGVGGGPPVLPHYTPPPPGGNPPPPPPPPGVGGPAEADAQCYVPYGEIEFCHKLD